MSLAGQGSCAVRCLCPDAFSRRLCQSLVVQALQDCTDMAFLSSPCQSAFLLLHVQVCQPCHSKSGEGDLLVLHMPGLCGHVFPSSQLRKDTPQESFSAYCSLHGYQIMRRMQWCPDQAALLEWYRQGLALPVGRDVALQARHKASFPKRHE